MPLMITDSFQHNGRDHRFVVFHLRDDPLSYRFVIEELGPVTEVPREVFMVLRQFEDQPGLGHSNPAVDLVIRNEFRILREEYIRSSRNVDGHGER